MNNGNLKEALTAENQICPTSRIRIVIMAVRILVKRGQSLEQAIAHYTALTDEERDYIRKELKKDES